MAWLSSTRYDTQWSKTEAVPVPPGFPVVKTEAVPVSGSGFRFPPPGFRPPVSAPGFRPGSPLGVVLGQEDVQTLLDILGTGLNLHTF